jgi:hypothetical protein
MLGAPINVARRAFPSMIFQYAHMTGASFHTAISIVTRNRRAIAKSRARRTFQRSRESPDRAQVDDEFVAAAEGLDRHAVWLLGETPRFTRGRRRPK